MKIATMKTTAAKWMMAAMAAGTLMFAGAAPVQAQEVVVRGGYGRPVYERPYDRYEFERRQEFLRREAFLRHEEWARYHRFDRPYGYR